jgi:signal transduction histidine kinase
MRIGLVDRIALVFVAAALAACIATAFDVIALSTVVGRTRDLLGGDMVNAVAITRSQNHLLRMNSNLTGGALAGSPDVAALERMVRASLSDYRDRMAEMRAASPAGAAEPDSLAPGFERLSAVMESELALISAGDLAAARDRVADVVTPAVERQVASGRNVVDRNWATLEKGREALLMLAQHQRTGIAALAAVPVAATTLAVLWLCGSGLRRPLNHLTIETERLRRGDLQRPVEGAARRDEVGAIAASLNMLREEALRARAMDAEALERAAARAAEADRLSRAKSDFLATMSHEIRSPMSGLVGVLELLRSTDLDLDQDRMATMVHNSATILLGVLNDILDFSKIEAGALSIEREPIRVRDLLRDVVDPQAVAAARKQIAVGLYVDPAVPDWIATDPLRLRQIISNLLSNAVKFISAGEVMVRVSASADAMYVAVRDSGIGMTAETLARLFNPFTQADGSTQRKYGGTGLGLSISHKLAGLLDGELAVTSAPGVGSEFTLTLPLPPLEIPATADARDSTPPMPERLDGRVLLADDDATLRWLTQRQLEKMGLLVVAVEDGQAALTALQEGRFDALLTDCHMPVMDGVALTRSVRASDDPALQRLPVIGLTADITDRQMARCQAAGMSDIVIKPVPLAKLARLMAIYLGRPIADGEPARVARLIAFDEQNFRSMFEPGDPIGAAWLEDFLVTARVDVAALQRLEEPAAIARSAHRLAGSSFAAGAMLLGQAARDVELASVDSGRVHNAFVEAEATIGSFLRQEKTKQKALLL